MALSLRDSHTSYLFVLDSPERERQSWESSVNLCNKLPCFLGLEHVIHSRSPLVHSVSHLGLLAFAFPSRHHNVDAIHLVHLKLDLVYLLFSCLCTNDALVAINDVFFHLVRQDTLHRLALELLCDFAEHLGDLGVCVAHLYKTQRRLGCIPSCHDGICSSVLSLLLSNDNSVSCCSNESINVTSHVDFRDIARLQLSRLAFQWRKVANDFIGGYARWKSNTLLYLAPLVLLIVKLARFFF
mmetsp:Transcript_56291/g.89377  ORF Transcript_56291/g.89377 Transcript_56291/m.89377 type:complete len:241 (-) Transcript_56291:233-955(-)